jgi:hypothetical protein
VIGVIDGGVDKGILWIEDGNEGGRSDNEIDARLGVG